MGCGCGKTFSKTGSTAMRTTTATAPIVQTSTYQAPTTQTAQVYKSAAAPVGNPAKTTVTRTKI